MLNILEAVQNFVNQVVDSERGYSILFEIGRLNQRADEIMYN